MEDRPTLLVWFLSYGTNSLFWWWILALGGAKWVEGWKSFFIVHWLAPRWDEEGIKLFALSTWILSSVWFVVGLFKEEYRLF